MEREEAAQPGNTNGSQESDVSLCRAVTNLHSGMASDCEPLGTEGRPKPSPKPKLGLGCSPSVQQPHLKGRDPTVKHRGEGSNHSWTKVLEVQLQSVIPSPVTSSQAHWKAHPGSAEKGTDPCSNASPAAGGPAWDGQE